MKALYFVCLWRALGYGNETPRPSSSFDAGTFSIECGASTRN